MKNFIIKSNEWYDDLPEPKRFLLFLIIVCGGVCISNYLLYATNNPWPFVIWTLSLVLWRMSYSFIKAFGK